MEYRYRLLDICCATNLITFSLVQLLALLKNHGGEKIEEQRRQSLHLSPVFFENVQMTYCTVMSRLSDVETFAQLKAAHQSGCHSSFLALEVCCLQSQKHLIQPFIAGGCAGNLISCIKRKVTMH